MPIGNGGIIGPNNTSSTSSAKGVWSIREAMLAQRAGNWPVTANPDPYFEYTTLLLPGNGTNGAQNNTFLDSSTNNFTITRNGNTTQGTFSPFSQTGWSNYFDGTGDYLSIGTSTNLALGANDFTIECFLFMTAYNGNGSTIWDYRTSGGTPNTMSSFFVGSTGVPVFYVGNGSSLVAVITGSSSVLLNVWNHLALVRSGSTITLYLNGVSIGSATNTTDLGIQTFRINDPQGSFGATAYFSNFRIVKGTAVYTANFTPSTTPLTAITNTSLLTCQSNRFVDNSSNAFAITRNGDVSVQAFSPFNPTAAWSAATNGGSGYFDGSGDYLTVANNTALQMGSGDFTIEYWWYPTSIAGYQNPIDKGYTQSGGLLLQTGNGDGQIIVYASGSAVITASTAVRVNAWNHMALVRNGTSLVLYLNGASVGSATNSTNFNNASDLGIGATAIAPSGGSIGSFPIVGYLNGVRFVKGTAVYTAAFTPPTAPLTAVTNTSLLLNFTNAGIYDATSKNDLETVGNAQISTTQSKFGGSSMYFDGTSDALYIPANPDFAFGTGDFTVECWVYTSETTADTFYRRIYITDGPTGNASGNFQIALVPTTGYVNLWDGTLDLIGTSNVCNGAWHHIAATRFNSTLRLFVDGIQQGSTTYSVSVSPNSGKPRPYVGTYNGTSGDFNGYINDLRITKGYARYTTNFTPPTAAFPLL